MAIFFSSVFLLLAILMMKHMLYAWSDEDLKNVVTVELPNRNCSVACMNPKEKCKKGPQYYFGHMHKAGGQSFGVELESLIQSRYWAQSECPLSTMQSSQNQFMCKSEVAGNNMQIIAVFRDPFRRTISAYQSFHREGPKLRGQVFEGTIEQWLEETLLVWGNAQTRFVDKVSLDGIWHVAVLEFLFTSYCTLSYKIGRYDFKRCECAERYRQALLHDDHGLPHDISRETLSISTISYIENNTKEDSTLHFMATKIVYDTALKLQKESGIDFLCGDRATLVDLLNKGVGPH